MNDAFHRWLLTEKVVSERSAQEIRHMVRKNLREMPEKILDEKKVTDLLISILTSRLTSLPTLRKGRLLIGLYLPMGS
jgi:site-specific recombinase XerD